MSGWWRDVRFGFRALLRKPGFTAAALVSLILGIGTNTAIFTLLDAIFLRPLPVTAPRELVSVSQTLRNDSGEYAGFFNLSWINYQVYRDQTETLSGLALYQWGRMNLSGGSEPQRATGMFVTANFFEVLGLQPSHGRLLLAEDDDPGRSPVAILSHGCWSRLFGADPGVVGQTVTINGHGFTVAGVGPRGFKGTAMEADVDFWIPLWPFEHLSPYSRYYSMRAAGLFSAIGRLRDGVSVAEASAEMHLMSQQLAAEFPTELTGLGGKAVPLLESVFIPQNRDRYRGYGRAVAIPAALILLIACINVANLLLVRGIERTREIAIRRAVGAGRRRMIRQLVTENLLLFLIGGGLSMVMARWSLSLLWRFRPPQIAEGAIDLGLDATVWGYALLVALVVGLLFGLVPALRASNPDLVASLKESDPQVVSTGLRLRLAAHSLLAVGQVALALVALIGAGLFLRSLDNLRQIDLGFRTDHLALVTIPAGEQGYDEAQTRGFYQRVVERVESIPGVRSAALSENRLLRGAVLRRQVYLEGENVGPEGDGRPHRRINVVGPGFFSTVGIPLRDGRDFTASEPADGPLLAIINETMAKECWPGENPIGKRFRFDYPTYPLIQVVGVVADAKYRDVHEEPQHFVYLPLAQHLVGAMTLHARTELDPRTLLPTLRREVQALDPNLPLADVETIEFFIGNALWLERASAILLTAFGVLALVLAVVGVYGVVAYSVGQRQRELGIRMAMGAGRVDLFRQVLKEAAVVVGVGLVLGLGLAALVLRPVIASQLYGVGATDPLSYVGGALVLVVAALMGCLVPARRAAKTDPMRILRNE